MCAPKSLFPSRERTKLLSLWLGLGFILLSITIECLFGSVEHRLSPELIRGGTRPHAVLPMAPYPWPVGRHVDVLENGRLLGPEVQGRSEVEELGGGAYASVVRRGTGLQRLRVLYFSSSDGAHPRVNGRDYVVRYPRRQLPASVALVLLSWIVLPATAIRVSRELVRPLDARSFPIGVGGWSVLVSGGLYSIFAAQVWLQHSSTTWLLAVGVAGLAPGFAKLVGRRISVPGWGLWIAGLLVWIGCTTVAGSFYASSVTAAEFFAISIWGLTLHFGFRGRLRRCEDCAPPMFLGLLILAAGLSLVRDAGFDLVGGLASLGLSERWTGRIINPWTTKFLAHWVLVVAWCTLAAFGCSRRGGKRAALLVALLSIVTIGVNGSKSAVAVLVVSVAVGASALVSPRRVRSLLITLLVVGALVAPLTAALPWRAQHSEASLRAGGRLDPLELDIRGGVWDFARRLVWFRPIEGWGFGASGNLPGRQITIAEAFDLDPEAADPKLSRHPVLPGGHPHNAALLTWLDLGLVGALLLAGLLVAIGTSLARVEEEHRGTHAALLGLLTVNAVYLLFNYPVWEPEIASILWMSAVLASSLLPRPTLKRRELLRSGTVVLVVLGIGCGVLASGRMARWMTAENFREPLAELDRQEGRVSAGKDVRDLEYTPSLDAGAELVQPTASGASFIRGWAYGPPGSDVSGAVLVFVGSNLAGVVWPERPSPDLFLRTRPRDVRALVSGFLVHVEPEALDLEAPVTVVALGSERDFAVELPPLAPSSPPSRGDTGPETGFSDEARGGVG